MHTVLNALNARPIRITANSLPPLANSLLRISLMLLLALGMIACERDGALLPESQYQTALVGTWQGSVDGDSESISFQADGRFSSEVLPTGFISTTLDQGVAGKVGGAWTLQGKVITLSIDQASGAAPANLATTSTITSFNQNKLVVKSDSGETSIFVRSM